MERLLGALAEPEHVVKIQIKSPHNDTRSTYISAAAPTQYHRIGGTGGGGGGGGDSLDSAVSPIRISVTHPSTNRILDKLYGYEDGGGGGGGGGGEVVGTDTAHGIMEMTSGQKSPGADSGTGSDVEALSSLPRIKNGAVSVTLIQNDKRLCSLADSDDESSNVSSDSLETKFLHDIVKSYEERKKEPLTPATPSPVINYTNTDMYLHFHLNERDSPDSRKNCEVPPVPNDNDTFAGLKDLLEKEACTIRSARGTVRGVRNRVRAGIATFLQINSSGKNYKEKDAGKVVIYTTTMGILRETYQACMKVKQILRTLLIKFEERDVFMGIEYQMEIRERMNSDRILVPQVFVDGQHIGDAEAIEKLNESGELRRLLKPYKSMEVCNTCKVCGGFRLLPCQVCNGSKKSVHRNHFTAEFVALKCMNCDEVGLVRCNAC